jgi:hypothetical protein
VASPGMETNPPQMKGTNRRARPILHQQLPKNPMARITAKRFSLILVRHNRLECVLRLNSLVNTNNAILRHHTNKTTQQHIFSSKQKNKKQTRTRVTDFPPLNDLLI